MERKREKERERDRKEGEVYKRKRRGDRKRTKEELRIARKGVKIEREMYNRVDYISKPARTATRGEGRRRRTGRTRVFFYLHVF